jgi:hypothetical protein
MKGASTRDGFHLNYTRIWINDKGHIRKFFSQDIRNIDFKISKRVLRAIPENVHKLSSNI